jgi:hypothetical protein
MIHAPNIIQITSVLCYSRILLTGGLSQRVRYYECGERGRRTSAESAGRLQSRR